MKKNSKKDSSKNINIFILLIVCFIIGFFIHNSIITKQKLEKGGAAAVSIKLKRIQHGVTKLTQDNINYLENSKEYGNEFKSGKIFVVYPYPGSYSPFSPQFTKAFNNIMANPKYTEFYSFLTFPETSNNQFFRNCHSFCIVNPTKKELFHLVRTGNDAAEQLDMIFDGLMSW